MINLGLIPGIKRFAPYPFAFLSLIIGTEFIFLPTFVLLNQKYQMRREEQWSHLHLQLSMLTEQEVTRNVQMLSAISKKLGLHSGVSDEELNEMIKPTSVTALVGEIEKSRDSGLWVDQTVDELARQFATDNNAQRD